MTTDDFLVHLDSGEPVFAGTPIHVKMCELSNQAMRITCELNAAYHTPERVRELFSELTGRPVDDSFMLFPPFYTDCGRNIRVGRGVFINANCNFQDQGGITIGEGSLIGHRVTMATLNHGLEPSDRGTLYPAPIVLGRNVWVGAGATLLPGVTVGDNAVVAAGAVVTRDVDPNTVVAGVPAKTIRNIT